MSLEWMDGFDHYGTGATGKTNMTAGPYAEASATSDVGPNTTNPRTGTAAFRYFLNNSGGIRWRRVLGGNRTAAGLAMGVTYSQLPGANATTAPIVFRDSNNVRQLCLFVTSTGSIDVRQTSGSGTILGSSSGPVIQAGSYQHIAMFATCHGSTGTIEVRVDGVTVINVSGVNTAPSGTVNFAQMSGDNLSSTSGIVDVDDFWCWNNLGTANNDFSGNVRVRRLNPDQDTAATDWVRNTGSTDFSAINQTAPDSDTTYIEAANLNDISEFDFENTPAEVSAILAAQTYVMMKKTDAGDSNVQVSLVSGASEVNGADRPITTAYAYWTDIFEVDPDTGTAWTKAAIDAAKMKLERTV